MNNNNNNNNKKSIFSFIGMRKKYIEKRGWCENTNMNI